MGEKRIVETMEFLTQVHTAWDGTEQRMALRENPRRLISYRYTGVKSAESSYLRALCYSSQTVLLEFPLWQFARALPKKVYEAQSQIPLAKSDVWDYRDCHAAMLWTNDTFGGERFALQGVTADGTLRLGKQVANDWLPGATTVAPVFWGVLRQEDSYTNLTSEVADLNLNVEFITSDTAVQLPKAADAFEYPRLIFSNSRNAKPEYLGQELFLMPPSWIKDEEISYRRNANRLDNQVGSIRYDLKSSIVAASKQVEYLLRTKEEIHFMQRFFYRCRGQLKSFYAPTWTSDLQLAEDALAGSNTLYTEFTAYWKYYAANTRRKTIAVFYVDGTMEIFRVAGYSLSDDGSKGKIYLLSALRKSLLRNKVRLISYLCKWRLASDVLTVEYETTELAAVSLKVQEVDD